MTEEELYNLKQGDVIIVSIGIVYKKVYLFWGFIPDTKIPLFVNTIGKIIIWGNNPEFINGGFVNPTGESTEYLKVWDGKEAIPISIKQRVILTKITPIFTDEEFHTIFE